MVGMTEQNISHRTKMKGTYILTFTSNSSLRVKNFKNIEKITCSTEYELMAKNWKSEI